MNFCRSRYGLSMAAAALLLLSLAVVLVPYRVSAVQCNEKDGDTAILCKSDDIHVPIESEYIVSFCDSSNVDAAVTAVENCGAEVLLVYGQNGKKSSLHGVLMRSVEPSNLVCVARLEFVTIIECNMLAIGQGVQTGLGSLWGLDRIDQLSLPLDGSYNYTRTGTGVHVYIVSSGIHPSHTEFGGRASNVYNAFIGSSDPQLSNFDIDTNGHGTHLAGIVGGATYGVAKAANLYGLKVLDSSLQSSTGDVIAAIDFVSQFGNFPAVLLLPVTTGYTVAIEEAVGNALKAGVIVIASGGNYAQSTCAYSPVGYARNSPLITVGASTSNDGIWTNSSFGPCVTLYAPGESILSASPASNSASATMSGTSQAAAFVAGVAALFVESRGGVTTPQETHDALIGSSNTGRLQGLMTLDSHSRNRLLYTQAVPSVIPFESPCDTCESWSGIGYERVSVYYPSLSGFQALTSGFYEAWVFGQLDVIDVDLYISKKMPGGDWVDQGRCASFWPSERFRFEVTAGEYYRWVVFPFDGEGPYTFFLNRACDNLNNCSYPFGSCDAPNTCSCNAGYGHGNCSIFDCYGVVNTDPSVCGGFGTCINIDTCLCDTNYYGTECDTFCSRALSCSTHGNCNSTGGCDCDTNYYGVTCDRFCTAESTCNSNGFCTENGFCQCDVGYFGPDCATFCDDAITCNSRGSCNTNGVCDCSGLWEGPDCNTPVCSPDCLNNGTCIVSNHTGLHVCLCRPGFRGSQCENQTGVYGDPHFVGFKGQLFDFQGLRDQTYCLISDHHFFMNAHFVGYVDEEDPSQRAAAGGVAHDYQTYMSKFGMQVGEDQIYIDCTQKISINGRHALRRDQQFTLQDGGTVSFRGGQVGVHVPHYQISVSFKKHPRLPNECYLNFHAEYTEPEGSATAPRVYPHGVLGQTAQLRMDAEGRPILVGQGFMAERKQGGRVIEGHFSEYRVSGDDIFSPNFKHSRFVAASMPMESFVQSRVLNTLTSRGFSEVNEPILDS